MVGLLLLLLAVVALVALLRRCLAHPAPRGRFEVLSRAEVAFVESAAEAMFPSGGAVPVSGREARVAAWLDGWLVLLPAPQRRQIRALLFLMEHGTLLFPAPGPSWQRFSSLSIDRRLAVLEAWSQSALPPRRLAFAALRALLTMGYLADRRALSAIGMAPFDFESPVLEADLLYPPIGRGRDAIRWSEADRTPPSQGRPLDPEGPRRGEARGAR